MAATKPQLKSSPWRLRIGERRSVLVIGDLVMSVIALLGAIYIWVDAEAQQLAFREFLQQRLEAWFFLLPFIWLLLLIETYNPRNSDDWRRTVRAVGFSTFMGFALYVTVYFTSEPNSLPRLGVSAFLGIAAILTLGWRFIYIRVFSTPQFMHRVLLVGAGISGVGLLKVVNEVWPPPFFLVGVIDDDPEKIGTEVEEFDVLGGCDVLLDIIEKELISNVIVSISGRIHPQMFEALVTAQTQGVQITRMPVAYEELIGRVPVHYLEADWMLRSFVDDTRISAFYRLAKRIMDISAGLIGVTVLALLFPFIALAILIDDGWPILFRQTRAGKGGVPYTIYKFRSMRKDAEKVGEVILAEENDSRTTRTGPFLRKSRLDETPQLINVLRGEMSLVGPRPERPELVEKFEQDIPFYRARLLDKPGLTGWAQINFDYAKTMDEMTTKLEYDLYYIKHRNLWMDILIALRTVGTIFGLRGR